MTIVSLPLLRRAIHRKASAIGHPLRLLAAVLICSAACAMVLPATALADDDLPGRVGRVADVGGELFLAPQDKPEEWAAIGLNYPVTSGDNLWAGNDARAEIDFGAGQFRLAGNTNLHISRLDDRQFALFVAQGRVNVRVRVLEPGEVAQIDTPNAQVVLTRPGLYRVDVSEDREHTQLSVREGEANVMTAGAVQQVLPGQTAAVDGSEPRYANVSNGIGTDGFDSWVASRDRRYDRPRTANYVSPQMVGAADLDQYGTWSQAPEYGAVWYPSDVGPDWAPYRNGYWTEVGAWGPTWVDYAPWGYAPFHYGRWAYIGGRWGWCPGRYVARPMWAPALVGWAGGSGWSLSVSTGAPVYGWVPLGWGEPYRPWWGRCSNGCWDRYNRPYAVNGAVRSSSPPTRYVNWNAPGGITAVSGSALVMRKPVQANLIRVTGGTAASAPVLASAPLVRNDPGQVAMRRPGQGMPQPASTFYPTTARQGITAQPGGAAYVRPSPTGRYGQQTDPPTVPPPATLGRSPPTSAPGAQGVGANTMVQPAIRTAPPPAASSQAVIANTPGAAPLLRGDQRTVNRPGQQPSTAVPVAPPTQSHAAPQQGLRSAPQQQGAPVQSYASPQGSRPQQQAAPVQSYTPPQANTIVRSRPQPPVQAQTQGTPIPAAPVMRSAPAAPVAAPVHVAPPPAAAPSPPQGGNITRNNDRGGPKEPNADRPSR